MASSLRASLVEILVVAMGILALGLLVWTGSPLRAVVVESLALVLVGGLSVLLFRRNRSLQRTTANLRLLGAVAAAANRIGTTEETFRAALDAVYERTGWPVGHVLLPGDGNALASVGLWRLADPERFDALRRATESTSFPPGHGLPGQALERGAPVWVEDVTADERIARRDVADEAGLGAAVAVPALVGTKVVAVLEFFAEGPLRRDEEIVGVLGQVGAQLGRAVERQRALEETAAYQDELEEERAFLEAILEHVAEGIVSCDAHGTLTVFNRAAKELHGLPAEPVGPEEWAERYALYRPDGAPLPTEEIPLFRALKGEVVQDQEIVVAPKELPERTMSASGRALRDPEGRALGAVITMRDVTVQKEAESALVAAYEREHEAVRHLEALAELKDSFLTAVSHELRTPLTSILGYAEVLGTHDHRLPDEQRRDFLRRLRAAAGKLQRLLTDLLDLHHVGSPGTPREVADVAALVRGAVEGAQLTGDRPLTLDLEPATAPVEPRAVKRIIDNLLENAVRHTPPGTPIWVHVRREAGGALIAVEDAGPGVPPRLREAIFREFEQGPGIPADHPGLGIGLALVFRLAQLHGGQAWVTERQGGGASFRVLLRDEEAVGSSDAADFCDPPPGVAGDESERPEAT